MNTTAETSTESLALTKAPKKGLPVSVWVGLIIIAVNALAALFGPTLAPYGESELVGDVWEPISAAHWLGTDNLGRDLLTRMLHGAQTSIAIALAITKQWLLAIYLLFSVAALALVLIGAGKVIKRKKRRD